MSASRSASSVAWARPRSVRGRSACPCQRRARFQSVSPWRASSSVVTLTSCRRLARAMDLDLRDRVCVVTGSTAGIGLATARLLAAEGARVVVTGRDSERVDRAQEEAGAALRVLADLAGPAAGEELIAGANGLGPSGCRLDNLGSAYP